MKQLIFIILLLIFNGCYDDNHKITKLENAKDDLLKTKLQTQKKDYENKIKVTQIENGSKVEIAKIESTNKLLIAKVNATATQNVAHTQAQSEVQTAQIDSVNKKEASKINLLITLSLSVIIIIGLIIFYLNNKKNCELKAKLHEEKLKQELIIKTKELEEKRLHKMLDIIHSGKLNSQIEEKLINSITQSSANTIEYKKG